MSEEMKILQKKMQIFYENYKKYEIQNEINALELKECLYDVLSWIEICIKENRKFNNLNLNERNKISAIKYANNTKKHSASIYKFTLSTLALYPSDDLYPADDLYPSDFTIYWNELPWDSNGHINQYKAYNQYLKGKDVLTSINDIYNIIKKYYI